MLRPKYRRHPKDPTAGTSCHFVGDLDITSIPERRTVIPDHDELRSGSNDSWLKQSTSAWTGVHDPGALAAFQDGETRLLYARDKNDPDGPLVFMPDGRAAAMRNLARAQLECFMDGCLDRRLTTVSRTQARDGFRHLTRTGRHASESLFHQQAKALIVKWIKASHPGAIAEMEKATVSGDRRPDVLIQLPGGTRVAVEVQYSHLSLEEWHRRHESYAAHDIRDLWLFGHCGYHMRPAYQGTGLHPGDRAEIVLNPLQRAVLADGGTLWWINPIAEQLATVSISRFPSRWSNAYRNTVLYSDGFDGTEFRTPPHAKYGRARLHIDQLADCVLRPDGLASPATTALSANERALKRIEALRQEVDRNWLKDMQERRAAILRRAAPSSSARELAVNVRPPKCPTCGLPVAQVLAKKGRHLFC